MPNLFLDKDLNEFVAQNTMSRDEFLANQKKLETETVSENKKKVEESENE